MCKDIGGSIRIPSAFNGLYGLRPSSGRIPYNRLKNSCEGQETMSSVVGPIAHSTDDLELLVKAVLSAEPWKIDVRPTRKIDKWITFYADNRSPKFTRYLGESLK